MYFEALQQLSVDRTRGSGRKPTPSAWPCRRAVSGNAADSDCHCTAPSG